MPWLTLQCPEELPPSDRHKLILLARAITNDEALPSLDSDEFHRVAAEAAGRVLIDLHRQGWSVRIGDLASLEVHPPRQSNDADCEKRRVRNQELVKRDEQLRRPAVSRFVRNMEAPREHRGRLVSIFDLMRDGGELAASLRDLRIAETRTDEVRSVDEVRSAIDPYVQIVVPTKRDHWTGLRLGDVWRYFRHTWSNQHTTVPGRTLALLVRDRAADCHPVIGIAALSSAIVQMDQRDHWIGWRPQDIVAELAYNPKAAHARWLVSRLEQRKDEIYVDDLIRDELFWPKLWDCPTAESIDILRSEAKARRADHQRLARRAHIDMLDRSHPDYWADRAESDLYRSKRCLLLADLMRDKAALLGFLYPKPRASGLRSAVEDPAARRAIKSIARRAKGDTIGTEVADLTVCGAVAPYNEVIGGKLIAMLAISPTVVRAYHRKYRHYESEIASSIAGRPISRSSRLVYVGTTSLYGTTSSQYNRVSIPAEVLDATGDLRLERLGRSRSFGTSHFSAATVAALVRLCEQTSNGARVNSLFGEGVNPKMRKVRAGLDTLGWPSDQLLRHGRKRLIYGVSLVHNLRDYLLGMNSRPRYLARNTLTDDVRRIADWWAQRWLLGRIQSDCVLSRVASHTTQRPVSHGARVPLPLSADP
ncbi:Druantia anti-phage system protein DruA [Candidatus Poriferisodalis sp.]|uniref:Druantia anti-phage system protein DruA n=1 Tax=Candidatus Poriferisodalis sp. TaxID=3101277 RepID=UPI003B52BF90